MLTSRRSFLLTSGVALAATGCTPALRLFGRRPYDVVLRGGEVFDGAGGAGREGDVAIRGGRIVAVGPALPGSGALEIDARGLAVAPGFVDVHSHADNTLFDDPRLESVVRQGVTTVVLGNDGASRGPSPRSAARAEQVRRTLGVERTYDTLGEFLRAVDRLPPAANVASMVGLGTLREVVVGQADRPATADELLRMRALAEGALAEGACGASTGLEYTPGAFAPAEELVALARPFARRGLPYATHLRNEDDRLLEAIEEAIGVARGAGVPLQISHLKTQGTRNWGKLDAAFDRIDRARRDGLDVAFDRYPYVAYQTGLSNLFPPWSMDGGTDAFLARLADPATAPRIRAAALDKVAGIGGWTNVMISSVRSDEDRAAEGQRLDAWARARGEDPYDAAAALLARSHGDVGMVGFAMSEDNLRRILAHPLGMVCSDGGAFAAEGPARRGHPHPRGLGTFPRVLGTYVRETRTLTLGQAIHKMTALPASRVKLADRGRLAVGYAADVVVFDPAAVADRATFADPFQYPAGIRAVLVNGAVALRDGERAGARTGRSLRP